LRKEAFDVLALKPGATAAEIKEAYRDLVKVWHPDRFANDLRLRQKAELRLTLINEAYRMLLSEPGARGKYTRRSESAASTSSRYASSSRNVSGPLYSSSPTSQSGYRSNDGGTQSGWVYGGLGILLILLASHFVIAHYLKQGTESAASVGQHFAIKTSMQQSQDVHPSDTTGARSRPKGIGRAKDSGLGGFRVWSLSAADTDRLVTLCSRQKKLWGPVAYQSCVKAQLEMIKSPASKPDLSALSVAERELIESACFETKHLRGQAGYDHCEAEQVASLAAEPARPDLSTLNDADRHSIESACANTENKQGPAAYNRCLERFMKALAQAN
jgi:curved DNA-binding protein CbpA